MTIDSSAVLYWVQKVLCIAWPIIWFIDTSIGEINMLFTQEILETALGEGCIVGIDWAIFRSSLVVEWWLLFGIKYSSGIILLQVSEYQTLCATAGLFKVTGNKSIIVIDEIWTCQMLDST